MSGRGRGRGRSTFRRNNGNGNRRPPRRLVDDENWNLPINVDLICNSMPDLVVLFDEFNRDLFNGELYGIPIFVRWSPKSKFGISNMRILTRRNGSKVINIDLSGPHLNGKTKKEMVEKLLHEMIHAWLYITTGEENRIHEANFFAKMEEINTLTGANVNGYHLSDKQRAEFVQPKYVWQCDGPCKDKSPFFGYLKRMDNRPPSQLDVWFDDHEKSCGGRFEFTEQHNNIEDIPQNFGYPLTDVHGNRLAYGTDLTTNEPVMTTRTFPSAPTSRLLRTVTPFSGVGHSLRSGETAPNVRRPHVQREDEWAGFGDPGPARVGNRGFVPFQGQGHTFHG